jgi:hypothetical protein
VSTECQPGLGHRQHCGVKECINTCAYLRLLARCVNNKLDGGLLCIEHSCSASEKLDAAATVSNTLL